MKIVADKTHYEYVSISSWILKYSFDRKNRKWVLSANSLTTYDTYLNLKLQG